MRSQTLIACIASTFACSISGVSGAEAVDVAAGEHQTSGTTSGALNGPVPGTIANTEANGLGPKATFFFAGQWRYTASQAYTQYYEYPVTQNASLYTIHPGDARHLGWSEGAAQQDYAIAEIKAAGFNVINMSFWGKRGLDGWAHWAPMHTSTYAHDELFAAAVRNPMLIQPVIESRASTLPYGGNSPACIFSDAFPSNLGCLEDDIVDLVQRYIVAPVDPRWSARWLRLYGRDGGSRYAVNLFEVWSKSRVSAATFAAGFDALAANVHARTGVWVGFTLDVRTPGSACSTGTCPTAASMGSALAASGAVLAIQPFRTEIDAPVQTDVGRRDFKRARLDEWTASPIPVIADLTAGYDGHLVFPGTIVYGNNDRWRSDQLESISGRQVGWTFSAWNGFTEGWAGMPTLQLGRDGTPADTMNRWLRLVNANGAGDCNYTLWVNGQPTNAVYGAICEKWHEQSGSAGPLGAPLGTETNGSAVGSRWVAFVHGGVFWTGALGAHEVHGAIYGLYNSMGRDASWLGLPTSDELPSTAHCAGGRYNAFQHGFIDWCPNGTVWAHP